MVSSAMLRHVALVIIDISEKRSDSFISVTRIGELQITSAITRYRRMFVLTRATLRNIREDGIRYVILCLCCSCSFCHTGVSYRSEICLTGRKVSKIFMGTEDLPPNTAKFL
jgi:hypothetical protein